MVGVPGRSKGCLTCKKRKKKCDLQQPTCGNCLKGKFTCGGYARELIIVHTDGVSGKGGSYKRPASSAAIRPKTGTTTQEHTHPGPVSRKNSTSEKSSLSVSFSLSPADTRVRDLNKTALELECLGAFLDLYSPKSKLNGQHASSPNMPRRVFEFISHSPECIAASDGLRSALLAVSAFQVGQAKHNRQMLARGIELYGKALCYLGKSLKDRVLDQPDDLLPTCFLLALYEQLNFKSTSEHSFQRHINGIVSLLRCYDPLGFSQPHIHNIFCEARHQGILIALADRKRTFLSSHPWMTRPWHNHTKEAIDTATDIVAALPAIFEEWDMIRNKVPNADIIEKVNDLKMQCWDVDDQLRRWRDEFSSHTSLYLSPSERDQLSKQISTARERDLPSIIAQFGLPLLYPWVMYWTTCVILYRTMKAIYQSFPAHDASEDAVLYLPRTDVIISSLCIARSAYFFLQPELSGLAAMKCIGWPVETIEDVLADQRGLFRKGECKDLDEIEMLLEDYRLTQRMKFGDLADGEVSLLVDEPLRVGEAVCIQV